jgi:phosphoglycolate phosphatase
MGYYTNSITISDELSSSIYKNLLHIQNKNYNSMQYKNLLFDLDGTLTDPAQGIVNSIIHSLNRMGIKSPPPAELLSFIGPPLRDSYIHTFNLSHAAASQAVELYREYYHEKGIYENKLYPGIEDILLEFKKTGFNLFLATSKPTVYAQRILSYFGLHHYFTGITGSNLDHTRTAKVEIIQHIEQEFTLHQNSMLMIGDRHFDILGARQAGINALAVSYGYGSIEELKAAAPLAIVHTTQQMKQYIMSVPNNP